MKKLLFAKLMGLIFVVVTPIFGQESPLKTTLYFPHWTDGEGWYNVFQFTNLLRTHSGKAKVRFYNNFGNEVVVQTDHGTSPLTLDLPVAGTVTLKTFGLSAAGSTQGLAVVDSDVRIAGRIEYRYLDPAFHIRTATSPSPTRRAFVFMADYVTANPYWQNVGVALSNPNDKSSYVDISLVDNGGSVVAEKRITLQPLNHIAELVNTTLFPEYLASRGEFHGTIEVVAERNIAAMALEFEGQSNGTFLMDNCPPLPPRYINTAEVNKHTIQAVYFVPKDTVPDPDYVKGIQFIAQEVLDWYDIELQRAGQQDLTSFLDFVRDSRGKIKVGLVMGQENLATYADINGSTGGFTKIKAELKSVYPDAAYPNGYMLVAVQSNETSFAVGGGKSAVFTVERNVSVPGYSLANFNEDYLRNGDPRCSSCTIVGLARWYIAYRIMAAAHELGHALSLQHSNRLNDYFPGEYLNIMFSRYPQKNTDNALSFFASSLMPDVRLLASPINFALESGEINTLIH